MSWIQFIRFVEKKTADAFHQVANLIDLEANCPLSTFYNAPTHLSEYTAARDGGGEDEVRTFFKHAKVFLQDDLHT